MSRNMSFALTTQQYRDQSKDVTRRLGWLFLKPGERVHGCKKCMGLRKDEPLVYLHDFECVSVRREPLNKMLTDVAYGMDECRREGFPQMSPAEFVSFFCASHKGCTAETEISRIEFKHL